MKIHKWKAEQHTNAIEGDLSPRQRALLAANIADQRHKAWSLEMLGRRNAVARWRGQSGCSVREVMRALSALPASSCFAEVTLRPQAGRHAAVTSSQSFQQRNPCGSSGCRDGSSIGR